MNRNTTKKLPGFSLALLFTLYFSQGLPSGFLAHTLPALMRESGVSLEYIGLIKLLAIPWVLKFLWAPFVDRTGVRSLGSHKSWILLTQSLLAGLVFIASYSTQDTAFNSLIIICLVGVLFVNMASATQDIATDGLAMILLPERLRGLANSIQVVGYKLGMIVASSVLLLSFDYIGWSLSFRILALVLVLLLIPTLFYHQSAERQIVGVSSNTSIFQSYKGFFTQPSMLSWVVVLLSYKVSDSLGSAMIKPMLVDEGYSLSELAGLSFFSSIIGLIGALFAGWAYYKLGAKRLLLSAGLLQSLGVMAYALLVSESGDPAWVYLVSMFEQFSDGLSTVALFSVMMSRCRAGNEGADFTVQASILVLLSGLMGVVSGVVAGALGFQLLFVTAGVLGLFSLLPVLYYYKHNC